MSSDVWVGSDRDAGGEGFVGVHPNQAYAFDQVLRYGMAFVQEAPVPAFTAGGALAAVQLAPSLVSFLASFVQGAAQGDAGMLLVAMGLNLVQMALALVGIPVAFLIRAGLGVMAMRHVRGEPIEPMDAVRHIAPAVRAGVYAIAVGLVSSLAILVTVVPLTVAVIAAVVSMADGDVPELVMYGTFAFLGLVMPALIIVTVVVSVLTIAGNAAAVDEQWPQHALPFAFRVGRAAPVTLLVTTFALGIANVLAFFSVACVIGLALVPAVLAVTDSGLMIAYLMVTRPEKELLELEFFKRNPPPF